MNSLSYESLPPAISAFLNVEHATRVLRKGGRGKSMKGSGRGLQEGKEFILL